MSGAQNLVLGEYSWIIVVGSLAAFIFGFGTGSNDVANAFGTSVGAKTLTLKWAVVIAVIFEFTGALVLGRVSQETISGGIADIGAFTTDPEFFAYGMMWALLVGGVWQICASYMELNVSATHSIIGAVVGFSMTFKGRGAVIWAQEQKVCTGPLTGYNHDGRPSTAMMPPFQPVGANTWVYLRGKWTVTLEDVYDPVTCATRNSTTALTTAELSRRTGLNITDKSGKPGNLATMMTSSSSTFDQVNFMVNMPGNNPIPTSAYPNPNNATLMKLVGTSPWWEFQLLTASLGGHPMICNNGAEVFPNAKVPAMPGQFYYQPSSTSPGICTTASNANLPFPPYKGVLIIVLSWFFSPVLTGVASAIIFLLSRHLVLRSVNAYKRSFMVLPPMAFLTFWVNIYFVFTKGAAKVLSRDASGWTPVRAAWIAAACAGSISFFSIIVVIPLLYRRINTVYQKRDDDAAALKVAELEAAEDLEKATAAKAAASENNEPTKEGDAEDGVVAMAAGEVSAPANNMEKLRGYLFKARNAAMHGLEVDVHNLVEEDELVAAIHANAEMFDEKAETVFAYMQVFSAICVIFSHGAGEVGYMSGPLGAIFSVIRSGKLDSSSSPPIWTVLVGAFGLIIGLGTYGYSVTRAVGTRMAKLTPSRGFAAELATAMVIMIAAQYGLPTSSSQCITGGIIGIALCEGKKGLNIKFLLQTFSSWIWTMIFVAMLTGFFFAQGAYAPSAQMARQIGYYEESLSTRANLILTNYKTMIQASGYQTDGVNSDQFARYLTSTIANTAAGQYYSYGQAPKGFYPGNKAPTIQSPPAWQMVGYLDTALALVQMSVRPDISSGYNMCNSSTNGTTSNYITTPTKFPWSQKALAAGAAISGASLGTKGPCTLTGSQPSGIVLTKAVFLGASPYASTSNTYEDKNGNLASGFNGTVSRLFSDSFGTVTLDQRSNSKVCQQAPCNQLYTSNNAYMG